MSRDIDPSTPNVARIYDYFLGGKDNYTADRAAAEELEKIIPDVAFACRENREFLGRVVEFLAGEAGITQFIDIGTGLPTMGNVHEIAQKLRPEARIVYVDYDPVVVRHAQVLLARNEHVAVAHADLRVPRELVMHPEVRRLIDFSQPVAILLVAILHFIKDEENPYEVVHLLKSTMADGSYLVISHATPDGATEEEVQEGTDLYKKASAPMILREHAEVLTFFDGLSLISPGVVNISEWRATRQPGRPLIYGGAGWKEP